MPDMCSRALINGKTFRMHTDIADELGRLQSALKRTLDLLLPGDLKVFLWHFPIAKALISDNRKRLVEGDAE